jgi:hypothetical protein
MESSPSRLPSFVAGLLVGAAAAGAFVFLRPAPTPPPAAVEVSTTKPTPDESAELAKAKQRISRLEADNLRLAERVQAQTQSPAAASLPTAAKKKDKPANLVAAFFGGDGDSTNEESRGAMRAMMETAMKQQLEGKMRSLKGRLNLTPEQEASIREVLEKQFGAGQVIAEKMMTGQTTPEELADLTKAQGNPEEQIKALLSPEQQQAYAGLQQEEIRNNARLVANAEMLQMQGALGLSQEQQDSVYKALFAATEEQLGGFGGDPKKAMDFSGNLDRKLASLKGVLTEEQLKSYEEMQRQQLKLIESMLPKSGAPGDVAVPNIQVLKRP